MSNVPISAQSPNLNQSYDTRINRVQEPPKAQKPANNDQSLLNVMGVIKGIAVGIFATIASFFLLVIFAGNALGFGGILGGALLIGAGVAVGTFFFVKHVFSNIAKDTPPGTIPSLCHADPSNIQHNVQPIPSSENVPKATVKPDISNIYLKKIEELKQEYENSEKELRKSVLEGFNKIDNLFKEPTREMENLFGFYELIKEEIMRLDFALNLLTTFDGLKTLMESKFQTKESYQKFHENFSELCSERISSNHRRVKTRIDNLKEEVEREKEESKDTNFSKLANEMIDIVSTNLIGIKVFNEDFNRRLVILSESYLSALPITMDRSSFS